MTELERMLKDTLTKIEQDFSLSLSVQGKELQGQRSLLAVQSRDLHRLQEEIVRINADLQALTRRLQDLAGLCENLEPLLSRLNDILNNR
jgi:septal ring factor EnvC (AmiA/AmiB activator)